MSRLTRIPVQEHVGFTGEVSLHGEVLGVDGLREKVVAAKAQGIVKLFISQNNFSDFNELPGVLRENLEVIYLTHISEISDLVFKK